MKNKTDYRDQGAIGALLDEYEKANAELIALVQTIKDSQLSIVVDPNTQDHDCRSIQSILTHVISAGYNYVIAIRNHQGENLTYREKTLLNSIKDYTENLQKMFDYNVALFEDYPKIKLESYKAEDKILTKWNQQYDVEQLMEHAIVHILRHRRQIERFLIKLYNN